MTIIRPLSLAVVFACAAPRVALTQQQFTLDQVLGAPFASDLVAAHRGSSVAWIVNQRGARNVWVATGPSWQPRQVTRYQGDDGQEIESLTFTPDGRSVVYVRGGSSNGAGERPNPALIRGGVDQAIWIASLDQGTPRKIAEGSSPELSPSGDSLAFTRGGQVWIVPVSDAGAKPAELTKLRGGSSSLRWSPDGKRLAFVSNRERHSFVGVWDFTTSTLRYIDPSTDQDGAAVWSPDGKSLAFIRSPSQVSDLIFVPERESPIPWSIRVADASTGTSREVWRAKPGKGSVFREIVAEDQLFWSPNADRIVFPWEADGWTHLYSVSLAGGAPALLTPGAFEVEHVTATPDGRSLVYSSNDGDIDRRHIWRVAVDGSSKPAALTSGKGLEWGPVVTTEATLVLRSDARLPARVARLDGGALQDLGAGGMPSDFPAAALVEPTQVILRAADGTPVHAQLFLPPNAKPGERHPAAIFFHGGSRRQMLLGWHYMYYYSNAYGMNQYLANHGYAVLSVNYRSGIGYGLDFREALAYGAAGASEYQDVVAAGKYMRARADVDPARVALWGGSYGGYLTAMGLARNSDLFAAGVDIHGVHDWNSEIPNFVPAYDSLHYAKESALAYRSSPISAISGWRSPVLLIHGDDDRNVPFTESVTIAYELRKRGVPVEELIFPDEVHDFLLWRNWVSAYRAADDFLGRRLKARATASSTLPVP
ncbi:MAG TPA: prolyl oligopeptidase family serine peptidase [Gemmatimonadaceae bacterium]|nr:prolyl oligopeptidase family serine peptidase [Gemmatimonadaceae bacterium]